MMMNKLCNYFATLGGCGMAAQVYNDVLDMLVMGWPMIMVTIGIVNGLFTLKNHIMEARLNRPKDRK